MAPAAEVSKSHNADPVGDVSGKHQDGKEEITRGVASQEVMEQINAETSSHEVAQGSQKKGMSGIERGEKGATRYPQLSRTSPMHLSPDALIDDHLVTGDDEE